MANDNNIIHQLNDFENFGFQPVIPPPQIPQLLTIWQWDTVNGLPFFESQHPQWERFLPPSLLACPFVNTVVGQEFVTGMNANVDTFTINCTLNGSKDPTRTKTSLLAMILKEDLKKLEVRSQGPSIIIRKTLICFLLTIYMISGLSYQLREEQRDQSTEQTLRILRNLNSFSTLADIVPRMINGTMPDPDLLLQDPYIYIPILSTPPRPSLHGFRRRISNNKR